MAMGKLSDYFSITKRERIGTLVALLLLSSAILYAFLSGKADSAPEGAVPNAQVMKYLTDSVEVNTQPDSITKPKKQKKTPKKKAKSKSTTQRQTAQPQPEGEMTEVPSF